jgi:hypothetical protein
MPALVLLRGSKRSRVVRGIREGRAPEERTVVTASAALCDRITPGSSKAFDFEANYAAARKRDFLRDLGLGQVALLLMGIVICLGSIGGAVSTFLNSKLGFGIAFLVLAGVVFAAVATAALSIQKALKIP